MNLNRFVFIALIATLLLLLAACSQPAAPATQPPMASETTVSAQALVWQLQVVDSTRGVGQTTSMALDSLGNPVIAYLDGANGDLELVRCGNAMCSSGNVYRTIDSMGLVGSHNSLVLDAGGFPVISYRDETNRSLKLARCSDANCAGSISIEQIDSGSNVGQYTSLKLDQNSYPVISYFDTSNFDLKLVRCGDINCTSGNSIQTLDSSNVVGMWTSLALDNLDNPVISYYDVSNGALKLVRCGNSRCTSGNSSRLVDNTGDVGSYTSLKLDRNGFPVIAYYDTTNGALKMTRCGDLSCAGSKVTQTLEVVGNISQFTASLALDSLDRPVISYYHVVNSELKLVRCGDINCSSGNTLETVDGTGSSSVGLHNSLALDKDGGPVISYYDTSSQNLKLARVIGDTTAPGVSVNQLSPPLQRDPVASSPVMFGADFSEPVTSFEASDVRLSGTADLSAATLEVSGGPLQFLIVVRGVAGSGTVSVTIPAGMVTDAAGNPNSASTSTDNTVTFDAVPPSVTVNQATTQADPAATTPVVFTAIFSEPVSDFTSEDVSLSGTIHRSAAAVTVSGGPSIYTISVDSLSGNGTLSASIPAGAARDTVRNSSNASTSTDNTVTIVLDSTPPVITPTLSGTLGTGGWYRSDVSLSWTVTDGESTISDRTGCDPQSATSDTTGVSFTCSATSIGGTATQTVTIKVDKTNPRVGFVNRTPANAAGWNNTTVVLNWACSDPTSGAVSAAISQSLSGDGANQSSTAICTDNAGNTASNTQTAINIDKTAPTLNPAVSPNPVLWYLSAMATPNASDGLSGIATQSCPAVLTSNLGAQSVICTAADRAGNTSTAATSYTVISATQSLTNLINQVHSLTGLSFVNRTLLLAQLNLARTYLSNGVRSGAVTSLNTFIGQVNGIRGISGGLTNAQANNLVAQTNLIIQAINAMP